MPLLDQKLIKKIADHNGDTVEYTREQISKRARRLSVRSEAALVLWAKDLGFGTAVYERSLSPDIREEIRSYSQNNSQGSSRVAVSVTKTTVHGNIVKRDKLVQKGFLNGIFQNRSRGQSSKAWYETWWGLLLIGVGTIIVGTIITNLIGLTKP